MESKRRPIFMTDNQVDALKDYMMKNSTVSHGTLRFDFKLTPQQINSLVLSDYLRVEGHGRNSRYYPGNLWDTTGSMYRYGSKGSEVNISSVMSDLQVVANRTKEDYERAYLFRIGDHVCRSWGNAPSGLGVVVDIQPVNRKVTVRWPFGTYQEHVDELSLIYRDNGDRQLSIPTIDKDIMDKVPQYFDPASYEYHRYEVNPYKDMSRSTIRSSKEKTENKKKAHKLNPVTKKQLQRVANVLVPYGAESLSSKLNQDYILTQSEIIVSVNTEKDNPLYKDTPWYITPDTADNVNDNGDAWTNGVIENSYRSFRGSYNFYEHNQVVSESKGRVVDSLLRKVPLGNGRYYYAVEILVATNKKHKQLANRIAAGDLNTLSMGCTCTFTQCSQCGHLAYTPEQKCAHLRYNKGGFFIDQYGVRRIVAELCGSDLHKDSVEFEEASWVEIPAWRNAKVHNIVNGGTNVVNVVGYLSTRLYGKDSFEIMLEDGKLQDIKLQIKKKAQPEDELDLEDFSDEESLDEVSEEGEESSNTDEIYELELGEGLEFVPSTEKELLEENIIESSKNQ